MKVVKRNKRLLVVDDADVVVYCPPSFLANFRREDLQVVADTGCSLAAIVEFEDRWHPAVRRG